MRYPKFALSCLFNLSVFLGTKIDRKRYQKFNQKSIKNPSKIDQKSLKIGVRRRSRRLFMLGAQKYGCVPRSNGHLGASWRPLGPSWTEKGGQDSSKWGPKTEAKSVLARPGGVLGASWRHHVADLMHF